APLAWEVRPSCCPQWLSRTPSPASSCLLLEPGPIGRLIDATNELAGNRHVLANSARGPKRAVRRVVSEPVTSRGARPADRPESRVAPGGSRRGRRWRSTPGQLQ